MEGQIHSFVIQIESVLLTHQLCTDELNDSWNKFRKLVDDNGGKIDVKNKNETEAELKTFAKQLDNYGEYKGIKTMKDAIEDMLAYIRAKE
jgi:hypothetical protein